MRRVLLLAVLLTSCTSASTVQPKWIEFAYWPGWPVPGAIRGTITAGGIMHATASPERGPQKVNFERQLRPEDIGRLKSAIAAHRAKYGPTVTTDGSWTDASGFSIFVYEAGARVVEINITEPCWTKADPEIVAFWNEIMRAVRSPDYEALDHAIHCD